ncbi:MAG: PGPGW domain-containing protein [Candidatus Undinarchaeales archaeon]|jgi:hypothetical protein|nr:PGPGW domain-containing protein [Candidatus Undinarchaeales archaeon]
MKQKIKKIIGIFLICIGIIGWFVPILQGWLLVFLGVTFLESKWITDQFTLLKKRAERFWKKHYK